MSAVEFLIFPENVMKELSLFVQQINKVVLANVKK